MVRGADREDSTTHSPVHRWSTPRVTSGGVSLWVHPRGPSVRHTRNDSFPPATTARGAGFVAATQSFGRRKPMAYQEAATPHRVPADRRAICVLLVDDQRLVGAALERLLASDQGIELHCCYNAVDAVARANEIRPAVILQDL